ncbi:hypothetical protein F5148DRAFT_1278777 [Russula earlei]|uniref:Uncharacterized protein n=1 Tax=Russula earlei TaxID=71964 RepID=A0ACC0UNW4_9AGAM|nr:hypothetical protein F5148DRAFT_1278777 [Russula earlei]
MPFIVPHSYMILLLSSLALLFAFAPSARAQQTLFPEAIPLAVRSPYLTCWDYIRNGTIFGQEWPTTYDPSQILGWVVLVRVDGLTYSFLGNEPSVNGTANLTNIMITPTQTVVTAQVGQMQLNLTFLNPIEPRDWVKQSIPFSYTAFTAKSLDGSAHAVQVYSDVTGEWNSGNRTDMISWSQTIKSNVIYHNVRLQTPTVFNEINNQADWGNLYYATALVNNVTYKIDQIAPVSRGYFVDNGRLDNQVEMAVHTISKTFPVFAMSYDLGTIQSTQTPVVWTVGYTTDPAINYSDLSGASSTRNLYYKTQYSDDGALIVDFLNDFSNASSRAQQLDQKILQDAASISNLLGDLVSLAIHQVYGSTQLTIGTDKSDVLMFMKNIGGTTPNRVNAVETLYAAFPAFLYIDPTLGAPLLEPLFRLQASPKYTLPYAAADLGSNYPNVAGSNSSHNQGVEQSANMLIMTYAQARASGDGNLINRYYFLLTSWADYLTNATLLINNQVSADGLSIGNQTNLAIKGIIAIQAMSKMSSVVRQAADAQRYSNVAASLYGQWKNLALGGDQHILAAYGQVANSWTLGYNLFADVWLGTGLVESSIYNGHSSFIDNITLTSTFSNYGMPVDDADTNTAVSSWNLFVAAITPNQDLRSQLISRVHNLASSNTSGGVFPLIYDSLHGVLVRGAASPAQGAMYAPLALKAPVLAIQANGTTVKTLTLPSAGSDSGKVVGAVVGGVAVALSLIVIYLVVRRRRRQKGGRESDSLETESVTPTMVTPFQPIPFAITHRASESSMVSRPLDADAVAERQAVYSTSSSVLPFSPPEAPIPVGLSSKDLARLRAEASRSQQTLTHSQSLEYQPPPSSTVVTEQGGPGGPTSSSETRRLQTEVESLRREMQELRTERFEPPPSYTSGGPP